MKKIFFIGLFLSGMCFAYNVSAAENFDYIPYIGVDYGYVDAKNFLNKPNYHLLNLNVGTKYNQNFGTEIFYTQSSSDTAKIDDMTKLKTSYRAYGLDV